jgi:hypothetical protein
MLNKTARLVAVALAVSCAAAPALAQPKKGKPLGQELTGPARDKFEAGKALYAAGNYDSALGQFLEAYELSKNPRVLYNVAVCQRNMNRYVAAIDTFKRELSEGGDKLPKDEVTEVNQFIAGLAQFVSSAEIKVNEPGAKVTVNNPGPGAPIVLGTSPLSAPVPVETGTRTFTASKPGFVDATTTLLVKNKEPAIVDLKLVPLVKKSLVTITVEGGSGATIFIDDLDMGPGPFKGEVTVGRHKFAAKAQGYKDATQTVEVEEGKPLDLKLALAADRKEGGLLINVSPMATIDIDGKVVGTTRRWDGPVRAGRHVITLTREGYDRRVVEVHVDDDETRDINVTLDRSSGGWVPWTLATLAVIGGATAAAFIVFRSADQQPVVGTLDPGTTPAAFRFR